ncbi:MAG: pyridoxal-phosphate dependent enzyme [Thermomicrobiales bacterium]
MSFRHGDLKGSASMAAAFTCCGFGARYDRQHAGRETLEDCPEKKDSRQDRRWQSDRLLQGPHGAGKDRGAEQRGDLKPGMTVVEFTGGSTGSSLAFVCAIKGYRFNVVSSDAFSREKLATMAAFGADVTIVPSHGKGINAELMAEMRKLVEEMAARDGVYWTRQFENRDSLNGYARIGEELMQQLSDQPNSITPAGVGTAGMLMVSLAPSVRQAQIRKSIWWNQPRLRSSARDPRLAWYRGRRRRLCPAAVDQGLAGPTPR